MPLIEKPESARRLARAIMSDIMLYNEEALRRGDDVGEAVAEGRSLFQSRVVSAHYDIFEAALSEFGFDRYRRPASRSTPAPAAASTPSETAPDDDRQAQQQFDRAVRRAGVPAGFFADEPVSKAKAGGSQAAILLLLILVAGVAYAVFRLTQ